MDNTSDTFETLAELIATSTPLSEDERSGLLKDLENGRWDDDFRTKLEGIIRKEMEKNREDIETFRSLLEEKEEALRLAGESIAPELSSLATEHEKGIGLIVSSFEGEKERVERIAAEELQESVETTDAAEADAIRKHLKGD